MIPCFQAHKLFSIQYHLGKAHIYVQALLAKLLLSWSFKSMGSILGSDFSSALNPVISRKHRNYSVIQKIIGQVLLR